LADLVQHAIYTMRGGLWHLKVSFLAKFVSGGLRNVVVKPRTVHTAFR